MQPNGTFNNKEEMGSDNTTGKLQGFVIKPHNIENESFSTFHKHVACFSDNLIYAMKRGLGLKKHNDNNLRAPQRMKSMSFET